jgi:hypothetical protein
VMRHPGRPGEKRVIESREARTRGSSKLPFASRLSWADAGRQAVPHNTPSSRAVKNREPQRADEARQLPERWKVIDPYIPAPFS